MLCLISSCCNCASLGTRLSLPDDIANFFRTTEQTRSEKYEIPNVPSLDSSLTNLRDINEEVEGDVTEEDERNEYYETTDETDPVDADDVALLKLPQKNNVQDGSWVMYWAMVDRK